MYDGYAYGYCSSNELRDRLSIPPGQLMSGYAIGRLQADPMHSPSPAATYLP